MRSLRRRGEECADPWSRWDAKNVCLDKGGPKNPSPPPADTDCPFNWSWHSGKGCCAPHRPPSDLPPPQCPKGWDWIAGFLQCKPPPTRPTVKPSTPSVRPDRDHDKDKDGKDKDGKDKDRDGKDKDRDGKDGDKDGRDNGKDKDGHRKRADIKKREYRSRNISPCPKGFSACPVSSLVGGDYECVDTLVDLDNCGGCASLGEGQNCNAIPGVWNVGCEQSACKSELSFRYPWLRAHLTIYETSLHVRRWLHSFQGRRVLQPSLSPPAVRSTANDVDPRWPQGPRPLFFYTFATPRALSLSHLDKPNESMDMSLILYSVLWKFIIISRLPIRFILITCLD